MPQKRSSAKKATKKTLSVKKASTRSASPARPATAKKATKATASAKKATTPSARATAKKATAKKATAKKAATKKASANKSTASAGSARGGGDGRTHRRAVRNYLAALETQKVRRSRRRSPESIHRRLTAIDEASRTADPLRRLTLVQERIDLGRLLATDNNDDSMQTLEEEFVVAARPYSVAKGITYQAWRAVGVEPRVLKAAGITRS